jgi:Lon protease-like protein
VFVGLIEHSNNFKAEEEISPVMFVSNAVLFPGCLLPIRVFESRYRMMLKDVLSSNRTFILSFHLENPIHHMTASLGLVRSCVDQTDGTSILMLEGLKRIMLCQRIGGMPYPIWKYRTCINTDNYEMLDKSLVENLRNKIQELNKQIGIHFEFYCSTESVIEITSTCDRLIEMSTQSISFKKEFFDCSNTERKINQTLEVIDTIYGDITKT